MSLWRIIPLCLVLLGLAHAHDQKTVLLEVTGEAPPRIVRAEAQLKQTNLQHVHSAMKYEENRGGAYDVYFHHEGKTVHARSVGDPRLMRGDALDQDGNMAGGVHKLDKGYVAVSIPHGAQHITVSESNGGVSHRLSVPQEPLFVHEKFSTQEISQTVAGKTEVLTIQLAGQPDKHKNLVFVSAGYQIQERAKFVADVRLCYDFLRGEAGGTLMSAPWDRYMPLTNVFAVFQPSVDSGASYPKGQDGGGGLPADGTEVLKNNNLDCRYGTTQLRHLNCDFSKVQALGSQAPPNVEKATVIALVNDVTYGGSGGNRVASIYTGTKMLQLLMHQLGHADADLWDEYSYGFAEPKNLQNLKNCFYQQVATPWDQWIGKNAPSGLGVGSPVQNCSYTNYWRPTADQCLMKTERSGELCAACAAYQIRSIYNDLIDLASPRCPRENEFIVITREASANLVANRMFFAGPTPKFKPGGITWPKHPDGTPYRYDKGGIDVMWHTDTGKAPSFESNYTITGAELGPGDHKVYLTVTDQSWFINAPRQGVLQRMTMDTTFDIRVVDAKANPDWEFCNNAYLDSIRGLPQAPEVAPQLNKCPYWVSPDRQDFYYCAQCQKGFSCNTTYVATPIDSKVDLNRIVSKVEDLLFGVGLALALVGTVAFVALVWWLRKQSQLNPREVIPYPDAIKNVRYCQLGFSFIIMLVSIGVILLAVWVYEDKTSYGKATIVVGVIFACFMYLCAYFGFVAAYYRSKVMLLLNGILLSVVVVVILTLSIVFYNVGTSIETPAYQSFFQTHWITLVKNHPEHICAFQGEYKCSGFLVSCHKNKMHSECPQTCEYTNHNNPDPCYHAFRYIQMTLYRPVGICAVFLALIMCGSVLCNWVLFVFIRKRNQQRDKRLCTQPQDLILEDDSRVAEVRAITVLKNLTRLERRALANEFAKVDVDGDGKIEALALKRFYNDTLGQDLSVQEVQQVLLILDTNGDGSVDFHELMACGMPAAEMKQREIMIGDPRISHITREVAEQLYEDFCRMDEDNNRYLSVKEIKRYYKKLFRVDANDQDLGAALKAMAHAAGEDISFVEFVLMFAAAQQRAQEMEASGLGTWTGPITNSDINRVHNPPGTAEAAGPQTMGSGTQRSGLFTRVQPS